MLGVILDYASLAPGDLDTDALMQALPRWRIHQRTSPAELLERIADAEVILTNKVVIDAAALLAAPSLKLIAVMATGTDHVDLHAARERGIAVCNVVNYSTPAVVQHTFALMLALATRLPDHQAAMRRADWEHTPYFCIPDFPVRELAGLRLGIVGHGAIGRAVAELGRAFGMEVLIAQSLDGPPQPQRLELAELLPSADVLSLHCPLTARSRHLLDGPRLALMKPGAWLINTARGALVDARALAAALRSGQLGGAALDVLDQEPPPADHPLLAPDIPNLILTPHSAWASRQARQRLVDQLVLIIAAFRAGRPCQLVNGR